MVYYENILNRAREKQLKEGIKYPEKDGKLYKTLKVFYIIGFAFAAVMNLMYIFGILIFMSEDARYAEKLDTVIAISVLTLLMVAALVISKFNAKPIIASIFGGVNIASAISLIFIFKNMMPDDTVLGGIDVDFYWRHLAPLAIAALCALGMVLVVITAYFKTKRSYNRVLEIVYEEYNALPQEDKPEWEDYVKNHKF